MTGGAAPSDPLVSFLIVSHNAGSFLRPCLESAVGQTYPRIEIVLVDNASTDGSVDAAIKAFGASGSFKLVRSATNLGPAGGAVFGLPHCTGDFIARQDADDVALPERIAHQVGYLLRHAEKDAVGADVMRINAKGTPWALGLSLRTEFLRRHASKWEMGCLHPTLLLRRSAAFARFYNPTLFASEDLEWIERTASAGRLGAVKKILCLYRQHKFSITRRWGALQRLTSCEVKSRLSPAASRAGRRDEAFKTNFSYLMTDPRLKKRDRERTLAFEVESRKRGDWLCASYFASIGGRWRWVPIWLLRAIFSGESLSEVAAFCLCRSVWPVWQRMHNVGFRVLRRLAVPKSDPGDAIPASIRLARLINRMRLT